MAGTSSAKTHSCAGARPRRNSFCEDTALLIHNRLPDPLRKRVLRLIGKGAVVVGQVRIALTNAAASGDRRPTLLHGREAAESYSARTVIDAAVLARARGSGCRHGNPSQRERRSGGRGGYFQKSCFIFLSLCVLGSVPRFHTWDVRDISAIDARRKQKNSLRRLTNGRNEHVSREMQYDHHSIIRPGRHVASLAEAYTEVLCHFLWR